MSFRIEDILKKDIANQEKRRDCENEDKQSLNLNSYSILQQTLLNKINPYFSQNNGDYYLSERLYSYINNNNEKVTYAGDNYADFHIGNPYISLCTRNHLLSHPSYNSIPVLLRMTSKRKGGQVRFTTIQTDTLEKRFNSHKYLSPEDRRILAESLKLSDKQVKTWFQNRRAKWRRFYNSPNCNNNSEKLLEN